MSDPLALLHQVANDAGSLVQVQRVTWNELPNDVASFVLTFQKMQLTVNARDDDTVELVEGAIASNPEYSLQTGDEYPWSEAIGKPIRWGWLMTNQQGYQDGIQIEFAHNVAEPSTIVQMVAVSSSLRVFCVQEKHTQDAAETHSVGLVR